MYIVTLRIKVPPHQRPSFFDASHQYVGPTQVQPGCISCSFYQDVSNSDSFVMIEEWENRKALDKHLKSKQYRIVLSLMDIADHPPDFKVSTISRTEGLEAVRAARKKERLADI